MGQLSSQISGFLVSCGSKNPQIWPDQCEIWCDIVGFWSTLLC